MSLLDAMNEIVAAVHANCKGDNPRCACACGCEERIGCTCWARQCTDCQINWMRGRENDGAPDCEPRDDMEAGAE